MDSIILERIIRLREELMKKDIEAALVCKKENCTYMSGFNGGEAYLIITQDEAVLVTDSRYTEQAATQAILYKIIQFEGSLLVTLDDVLKSRGVSRLGFEENYVTFDDYSSYKAELGISELIPLGGIIENLRIVKDRGEIDIIRKAVEIADNSFSDILNFIKPGVKELELAAELEYSMKRQGAKGSSFEIIVASGERSSMPHGTADERVLRLGDAITIDFGAIYKDYCSDMTRTVFLGQPEDELKKVYSIVLEAQVRAMESAKRGLTGKEIDAVARSIIKEAGYEKNFGHGLGHGVGLEIHEEPRLSPKGNKKMEDGMVVTVEPGIYIPGLGGVRIEDIIVIDGEKPVVLTSSTKEMIII
ncbi:MAG: aminopeptidase P family protein [Clostridia bacterium]|nr:aminopeptidase P family protein [Clostridia bacterium]